MKHYFHLQFKLLFRTITDAGVSPWIVILFAPILFLGALELLYSKTDYAAYVIGALALSFITKLSNHARNEFLQAIFSTHHYHQIRLVENILVALPFTIYLFYQSDYFASVGIMTISCLLAFWNNQSSFNLTIPTPFNSRSFEYIISFRQSFLVYLLPYFFLLKSIQEENMNLGIFGLILQTAMVLFYYTKPESEYIVWNYSFTPKEFLIHKLKLAWLNTSLINLLLIALLLFFNPFSWLAIIGFHILGLIYISYFVLLKYHAFPKEINVAQGIMLMVTLLFPPIILLALPYQFIESSKRLKAILK